MSYDKNNIFAKILRGQIPCKKVYENDHVLAFHDVNPQKKVHVLVIPKGEYIDLNDFNNNASEKEIVEFNKAISHVSNLLGADLNGRPVIDAICLAAFSPKPFLELIPVPTAVPPIASS